AVSTSTVARASDRSRGENRLALRLVAPAVALMLLVTAFPMLRALYLSLFSYSLTAPDEREFVGLDNYVTALTDSLFWRDTANTVFIMVVTVAVELVIGFAFAMVMHRLVFARGLVRTLDPHPLRHHHRRLRLRLAVRFSNTNGFVNQWLPPFVADDFNWFASYESSMVAIMVSEIWKTTPFMALLLLAGLAQCPRTCSRRPRSTARRGGSGCGR
ncbi:MAG: sugar ABC transporter permease, partial [Aeromicrobium erythreum]